MYQDRSISIELLEFWHYAEGLQRELRSGTLSNERAESVAEHSWRMSIMAMVIAPKLHLKIDITRTLKMIIIHDITEIEATDILAFEHFFNKKIAEKKKEKEKLAMIHLRKKFKNITSEIEKLWIEFEEQNSPEAKFVKALDKLDSRIQVIDGSSTGKWSEDKILKYTQLRNVTAELCNIDIILKELEELSGKERKKKYGF